MYIVSLSPNRKQSIDSRKKAIRLAKEASESRRDPVKVLREDGWERMFFEDGSLSRATFVTRDRRHAVTPLR